MHKLVAALMLASCVTAAWLNAAAEARAQRAETQVAVAKRALEAWAAAPSCEAIVGDVLQATSGDMM